VKEAALDQGEMAQRRKLHKLMSEDVIDALCSHFRVPTDSLGEWDTALRAERHVDLSAQTPHLHQEPADRGAFSGLTYSDVSKANQRFALRMSEDRDLRKTVEKITRSMSTVKALLLTGSMLHP
jgi:hypothetical protein